MCIECRERDERGRGRGRLGLGFGWEMSGRRGRKERRGGVVYKGEVSSEREMDREKTKGYDSSRILLIKLSKILALF